MKRWQLDSKNSTQPNDWGVNFTKCAGNTSGQSYEALRNTQGNYRNDMMNYIQYCLWWMINQLFKFKIMWWVCDKSSKLSGLYRLSIENIAISLKECIDKLLLVELDSGERTQRQSVSPVKLGRSRGHGIFVGKSVINKAGGTWIKTKLLFG